MQIYKIYSGLQNFSSLLTKYCREVGAMRGLARDREKFFCGKKAVVSKKISIFAR